MPASPDAVSTLQAWCDAADDQTTLDASRLDLSNADLSGSDLALATFFDANLTGAKLVGADLYRAQSADAVLDHADLTEASLVKTDLRDTSMRSADLTRANLGSAEFWQVDARMASFRYSTLDGSSLLNVALEGADLTGASVQNTTLDVTLDDGTVVVGLSGTVRGPAHLSENGSTRELAGLELELWLNDRGANVQVLNSPPTATTYYARINDEFPRAHPMGVVRRRRAGTVTRDEAFTRNLRWESTEYLRRYEMGSTDGEHVEISEEEANRFISDVTGELQAGSPN
ncbi:MULTISPECIES: pentapeptide repeat-containing protein [unclassified Streptomyces]|uniref:pentapeptide repeat-containing protein n=1 Tax=unclassified Streptomyces TaxID=2593676 RepID=UPI00278C7436|nr:MULTISPECIES: pentapeptide repeat-containing protein [unclassified Streptomyces]